MNVYVVSKQTRDDENCENYTQILDVYESKLEAIEYAKKLSEEFEEDYPYIEEEEESGDIMKYYRLMDRNFPEEDITYCDFICFSVTEHKFITNNESKVYKLTIFEDLNLSFPSEGNHKTIIFKDKEEAFNEIRSLQSKYEEYFKKQNAKFEIHLRERSFEIYDESSKVIVRITEEILK